MQIFNKYANFQKICKFSKNMQIFKNFDQNVQKNFKNSVEWFLNRQKPSIGGFECGEHNAAIRKLFWKYADFRNMQILRKICKFDKNNWQSNFSQKIKGLSKIEIKTYKTQRDGAPRSGAAERRALAFHKF